MQETIRGHVVEFYEDTHLYLVDGVIVPSVSEVITVALGNSLKNVNKRKLDEKAKRGTELHNAIEKYENGHDISDFLALDEWAEAEIENYKGMMGRRLLKAVMMERMLIIPYKDKPYSAGRFDMVVEHNGAYGLIDFKRRSSLEKDKHIAQLNLYRLGLKYSYDMDIEFMAVMQLHEGISKYVEIPINERISSDCLGIYDEAK